MINLNYLQVFIILNIIFIFINFHYLHEAFRSFGKFSIFFINKFLVILRCSNTGFCNFFVIIPAILNVNIKR